VVIVWDLRDLGEVDAGTVDALARLQLAAKRLDARIVLRNVPSELVELLDLFGLTGVLPSSG
jgi:ABC-type transporter Mla MlaB component